jgi:hypothetical protein
MARKDPARASGDEVVSTIPALAAAMAALLIQIRPVETPSSARDRDERRLWLVAAVIAVLVR